MKRILLPPFILLLLAACTASAPPTPTHPQITQTQTNATDTTNPTNATNATDATNKAYTLFSINVQDFSYPDRSAAVLEKIITLHEETGVPVDIYLTDQMARTFAEEYPDLLERLRTSPVVAVSYHVRPPRPYSTYDWLGLKDLSAEERYAAILRYETHAMDPVSGETTEASGGYQGVANLIGYPPYAAAALSGNPDVQATVWQVFADLGAQMTVTHGKALNLGDTKGGLPVRPEHAEFRLFEYAGDDPGAGFEAALTAARAKTGETSPVFVGVKMHDNDFFASDSAWVTVYSQDRRRPPWDPTLKAALLSPDEQEAVWARYEATVRYVAAQGARIAPVNLPLVLEMLK